VRELHLTVRERWRAVGRQLVLAVAVVAAVVGTVLLNNRASGYDPILLAWGLLPPVLQVWAGDPVRRPRGRSDAQRPDRRNAASSRSPSGESTDSGCHCTPSTGWVR